MDYMKTGYFESVLYYVIDKRVAPLTLLKLKVRLLVIITFTLKVPTGTLRIPDEASTYFPIKLSPQARA